MRFIINYIRQSFCKHDFEKEDVATYSCFNDNRPYKIVTHMICNKCGYHTKYKK